MRRLILGLILSLTCITYSNPQIKISTLEKLSFQRVAVSQKDKDEIRASGYIKIELAQALEEGEVYIPRLLVINHLSNFYLSNTNHVLKVKNINISSYSREKDIIIDDPTIKYPGVQVEFRGRPITLEVSGLIDRNQIDSHEENIEGVYNGSIALDIKQFRKK